MLILWKESQLEEPIHKIKIKGKKTNKQERLMYPIMDEITW